MVFRFTQISFNFHLLFLFPLFWIPKRFYNFYFCQIFLHRNMLLNRKTNWFSCNRSAGAKPFYVFSSAKHTTNWREKLAEDLQRAFSNVTAVCCRLHLRCAIDVPLLDFLLLRLLSFAFVSRRVEPHSHCIMHRRLETEASREFDWEETEEPEVALRKP